MRASLAPALGLKGFRPAFKGFRAPSFSPADLSLYGEWDAGRETLNGSGATAAHDEAVATWGNLESGVNAASDLAQATSGDRPRLISEVGLYLPGVAGNTATVPLSSSGGDTLAVTTVPASAAANVTATAGAGSVTIGPGANAFFVKSLSVTVNGSEQLAIDFTNPADAHNATSITATTGQTVTINQSGTNPATLVRVPAVRFNGVDQWMNGTLAGAISGGRLFALISILGTGGATNGRIFGAATASGGDAAPDAALWLYRRLSTTSSAAYYEGSHRLERANGFTGRALHEVLLSGSAHNYLLNGGAGITGTTPLTIAPTRFNIGGDHQGNNNAAFDLFYLGFAPAATTENQATAYREYIASLKPLITLV